MGGGRERDEEGKGEYRGRMGVRKKEKLEQGGGKNGEGRGREVGE